MKHINLLTNHIALDKQCTFGGHLDKKAVRVMFYILGLVHQFGQVRLFDREFGQRLCVTSGVQLPRDRRYHRRERAHVSGTDC